MLSPLDKLLREFLLKNSALYKPSNLIILSFILCALSDIAIQIVASCLIKECLYVLELN